MRISLQIGRSRGNGAVIAFLFGDPTVKFLLGDT